MIKICDMTSRSYFGKMNSILGSVVPLAMFFTQSLYFLSQDECNNPIFKEICFNVEALILPMIVATSKLEKLLSQIVNILDEQ